MPLGEELEVNHEKDVKGDMKKYQVKEDMGRDSNYLMTKIVAGLAQGNAQQR